MDRIDLVEKVVEIEQDMVQRGESQEEIDARVEESIEETIETAEFEEKLEKIIEAQELERLKLVDHEDEEDIDDAREEIDQPAEAEYYMEVEEELHRQGMTQEEIDEQMEEIASNYQKERNKKQEKEEDLNVSEELEKHDLETNEQNSSAEQCDQIELTSTLSSEKKEESEKEENESLQELYRRETGRRPIYARQKSKGYSQWLEQRELRSEKTKNSKSESEKKKEIEEEGWKTTLKRWIKEASEEECNVELKSELKKALESYNEFEYLTRKFLELYEKSQYEKLIEIEKNRIKSLTDRLQGLVPIQLELLANIRAFKDYFYNHLWELMNRFFVNRVRSKFFKHISQKYQIVIQELQNSSELKVDFKNKIPNNKTPKEDLGIVKKSFNDDDKGKIIDYRSKHPLKKIINKVDEFGEISESSLIDIDRDTIIKLLHKEGVREKKFIHNEIPYYFKWINQKIKNSILSLEFRESLIKYFDYLIKGDTFGIFLSNTKNFSCSSFKIKYLRFGSRKLIRKNLIKKNLIIEYNTESKSIPLFLRNLIHSAGKIEDYMRENNEPNVLRHSRLEDLVLLNNKNVLAIEVPIWDNISYITGHIDIISYYHNSKKSGILIADYKPDVKVGKSYDFVSFLPQVCMYGLLFRKAFGLNNDYEIKCLIFNRECCWIFKPDLIYDLRKEIREYYNPNRFEEFKDIFGNIQDYLLTYWITMCKLKCLTNSKLDSFLLSIKYELLKILNIENKTTFADIGREILRLINILNENSNTPLKSESLSDLIHASQHLFNLNFNKNEQDILIDFFNSFRFDLGLWGNNLSYQTATSLKILHSIQKLCYVFSHGFSKKMIQRGKSETYKEYLMFAYLLSTKFTGNNYFSCLEIIHVSNRTYATFITQRNKLIRYGLIEKVGYARIKGGKYYFLYNLTKKGVMLTKMILKVWNSNFNKEFKIWYRNIKKLYNNWLKNEYPPLDFTVHMVGEKLLPESTQKLQGSDPEFKLKVSEALKKKHKQPEYRKKIFTHYKGREKLIQKK